MAIKLSVLRRRLPEAGRLVRIDILYGIYMICQLYRKKSGYSVNFPSPPALFLGLENRNPIENFTTFIETNR